MKWSGAPASRWLKQCGAVCGILQMAAQLGRAITCRVYSNRAEHNSEARDEAVPGECGEAIGTASPYSGIYVERFLGDIGVGSLDSTLREFAHLEFLDPRDTICDSGSYRR